MTIQEHTNHIKFISIHLEVDYDEAQTLYYSTLDKVKKTLDPSEHPLPAVLAELGIENGESRFSNWSMMMKEKKPEKKKQKCEKCGAPMKLRNGPRGPFMGCTNYPDCDYTVNEITEDSKPNGEQVVERVKAALAFIETVGGIQRAKAIIAGIEQLDSVK